MKIEEVEENIFYYKDVIENPRKLIMDIEDLDNVLLPDSPLSKWKDWIAYQSDYAFGRQKQFTPRWMDNKDLPLYDECLYIHNTIYNAISKASVYYSEKHDNLNAGVLSPLSISKYFEGKHMGPHVDAHDDDPTKTISCVLYLNEDYDGGELNFPNHNIQIKPEEGSLVIFPSKYMHESKMIRSGVKYITPGFWNKV